MENIEVDNKVNSITKENIEVKDININTDAEYKEDLSKIEKEEILDDVNSTIEDKPLKTSFILKC